jgi:nitroreductase
MKKALLYIIPTVIIVALFGACYKTKKTTPALNATTRKDGNNRHADYPVNDIFINRWSPYVLSGEAITEQELMSLFEAARWAPSSYNDQQWRFIYAHRDTPQWDDLFNLMIPFNQGWAHNAGVLIVVISRNLFERNNKPSVSHSFDTGAAWMSLALQASTMGLAAHAMEGFDYAKARTDLNIPSEYTVEAMIAVGRPVPFDALPAELQKTEVPSNRKKIEEFIFEGKFQQ